MAREPRVEKRFLKNLGLTSTKKNHETNTVRQLSQGARRRKTQGLPRVNWPSKTILSHAPGACTRSRDTVPQDGRRMAEIQAEKGWKEEDGLRGRAAGRRCRNLSGREGGRVMRRQSVI